MTHPQWFDLDDEGDGVLEFHEALTCPGPALELQVMQVGRDGIAAWWVTESGECLACVPTGQA